MLTTVVDLRDTTSSLDKARRFKTARVRYYVGSVRVPRLLHVLARKVLVRYWTATAVRAVRAVNLPPSEHPAFKGLPDGEA